MLMMMFPRGGRYFVTLGFEVALVRVTAQLQQRALAGDQCDRARAVG